MTTETIVFKYKPGDSVWLIGLKLPGNVTGCMFDSGGKQYRVVWWWDGLRHTEWLYDFEIGGVK